MEDTLMTAGTGEDDIMLPDGFGEGDDFFDPESWTGASGQADETAVADEVQEEENGDSSADEDALTMGNQNGGEEQSAEGKSEETTSDGTEGADAKPSRKVKLKINHEEEEVDIDKMSDEDLIAHLQKSRAYDASVEAENKRRFREIYREQIDAGMTEAAARLIAASELGGKAYPLEENAHPAAAQTAATVPARDIAADVAQLKALYPDFHEVPDEVAKAYANGVPLLTAYVAYRGEQSAKANASLKKENAILKQNAASAARAPLNGVSRGGKAQPKVDPLLEGFDSDSW